MQTTKVAFELKGIIIHLCKIMYDIHVFFAVFCMVHSVQGSNSTGLLKLKTALITAFAAFN